MEHDCFRHPVTMLVGLGLPAEIYGLREGWSESATRSWKRSAHSRPDQEPTLKIVSNSQAASPSMSRRLASIPSKQEDYRERVA